VVTSTGKMIRNNPICGLMRMKNSEGKTFTILNYAHIFTTANLHVANTDEDKITTTRTKIVLTPLGLQQVYGDVENVSLILSRFVHGEKGSLGSLSISPADVKKKALKALNNGNFRREGKRVVSLFWCCSNFLKRQTFTPESEWLTMANPNLDDYMEESMEDIIRKHVQYRPTYIDEMEAKIEKSLLEKLSAKLKRKG